MLCRALLRRSCLLLIAFLQAAQCATREIERAALVKLGTFLTLENDIYIGLIWDPSKDNCLWPGISCATSGEVTAVLIDQPWRYDARTILSCQGLEAVAALDKLQSLQITQFCIEPGCLPDVWAGLQHLEIMELGIAINGSLPGAGWAYPGSFPALRSMVFKASAISGTLPAAWAAPGAFPRLEALIIEQANLTGSLPPEWAAGSAFPSLQELRIEADGLTGRFPGKWLSSNAAFPSLRRMELSGCAGSGELPYRVALPLLIALALKDCGLSGTLPASWGREGHLSLLEELNLEDNHLRGPLPDTWLCSGEVPTLEKLSLSGNMITSFPSCCPQASSLLSIELDRNQLRGALPFPEGQCNGTGLTHLNLAFNKLTGTLPAHWPTTLPGLTHLVLEGNQLSGKEIPSTWVAPGAFHAISTLNLSGNRFPWAFPLVLLKRQSLTYLGLAGCGVHGSLPPVSSFPPAKIMVLYTLNLSRNSLTGSLPHDWAASTVFQKGGYIDLSNNELTGRVPEEWVNSRWLRTILLQGNNLSGPLPVPTLDVGSAYLKVLPGNGALCWPKAATLEAVYDKPYVCGAAAHKNLTKLAACRLAFRRCALHATGGLALGLRLALVALLAMLNLTLLALAFRRRCCLRRRTVLQSTLDVQLAESQGSTEATAHELGVSDATQMPLQMPLELEALLRNVQPPSGSQGGLFLTQHRPLGLQGFPQHEELQAQLLAQNNKASPPSSAAPAVALPPGAWSSRLGRVQMQDVEFCRAADGSLVLLGQGASGVVFKAELAGSGPVAVKVLRKQSVDVARLLREAEIMHLCRHPSLLELVGVCEVGGLLLLVSEFVERGSLDKLLCLPEMKWHARGRGVLLDVAQAVQHLHFRNVLHADIKVQNVLVTHYWHAKLADVGTARYLRSGIASGACGGTILYAAPEQLMGLPCTAAADIFSLGLLMLAVVVGQAGQVRGLCPSPRVPEHCPAEVADLVAACLQDDPAVRPTAVQVVEVLLSS